MILESMCKNYSTPFNMQCRVCSLSIKGRSNSIIKNSMTSPFTSKNCVTMWRDPFWNMWDVVIKIQGGWCFQFQFQDTAKMIYMYVLYNTNNYKRYRHAVDWIAWVHVILRLQHFFPPNFIVSHHIQSLSGVTPHFWFAPLSSDWLYYWNFKCNIVSWPTEAFVPASSAWNHLAYPHSNCRQTQICTASHFKI